jgi:methionyl-tRNA formyltransferase
LINAHPGQLPEYAGLQAALRGVNDCRDELCCSVHWIAPGIDAGPLLALHRRPLDRRRALLDQVGELYPLAIPTMLQVAAECEAGRRPPGEEQDFTRRRYRSMPGPEEFDTLRARGQPLWDAASYRRALSRFLPPGIALPPLDLPSP